MEPEIVPERIGSSIRKILFQLLERTAAESEVRSFYESLRLVRLGILTRLVDRIEHFWNLREGQRASLLLSNTASLLKEFSGKYSEGNRFREAFEGLSTELSRLHDTMEKDAEFSYRLRQLRAYLTEVDQAAEFYERIARESNLLDEYVALLKSNQVA